MGREIRRVPPNWEHPRYTEEDAPYAYPAPRPVGKYRPLFDSPFYPRMREWMDEYELWRAGTHPDQVAHPENAADTEFWQWGGGPPDPAYYRPEWPEGAATWYQMYETVTEGTPLSPPFATPEELVDWLTTHIDYWDQGPRSRENAEAFVRDGWAPSAIIANGKLYSGPEVTDVLAADAR